MDLLEIFTFGGVVIHLGGKPLLGFHSKKAKALLVYLSLGRIPQPREKLAEMLWEQRSQAQAMSNLRVVIANLRKLISPYLKIDRQTIAINPEAPCWCDALAFDAEIAEGRFEDALRYFQGDFLEGFYLSEARGYEVWLAERRQIYQHQIRAALHARIKQLTSLGGYENAIQHARWLIALDPLEEAAHLSLMRLLALTGQRNAALALYQSYARTLEGELAVDPSAEMSALFRQIQSNETPGFPSSVNRVSVLPAYLDAHQEPIERSREIFVGRERELVQLDGYLSQMLQKQGGVIFVTGEVGSGKTALVGEFSRRAQATHPDLLVVMGNCHLYTGVGNPYGPWREALDMLTGDVETHWSTGVISRRHAIKLWNDLPLVIRTLERCAPALVGTLLSLQNLVSRVEAAGLREELSLYLSRLPDNSPGGEQNLILHQYLDFMASLSTNHPLLIILEDLQWIDPSSVSLLSYLVPHLVKNRILVVCTYRPVDLSSHAEEFQSDLEAVLLEFKRQFGNIWISLDSSQNESFVQSYLDAYPNRFSPDFSKDLTKHTGGQPLFVVELFRDLQIRGQLLLDDDGHWVDHPNLDWESLPARVEAVLEMHLARLDDRDCEVLAAASVIGEEFACEVVASLLGWQVPLVQEIIDNLIHDHALLLEIGTRRFQGQRLSECRFRHLFFQIFIYKGLGQAKRMRLHEKAGLTLEAFYDVSPDMTVKFAQQLARHFQEAGLYLRACDYLLDAGNQAVQLGAHTEAIQHFHAGLDLLQTLPENSERLQKEIKLSLALYAPLQALRGYSDPELIQLGARVRYLCDQASDDNPILPALYFLRITHKTIEERELALQRAELILNDSSPSDQLLTALSHWTLGAELSYRGEFKASLAHLERVNEYYQPESYPWCAFLFGNDPGISSRARLAWVLWLLGYPDQAIQESKHSLAAATAMDHSVVLGFAIGIAGVLFNQLLGDVDTMERWNQESIQRSSKDQLRLFQPGEMISRGWVLTQIGREIEGLQMMEDGLDEWRESGASRHYAQYLGMLAEGYSLNGQITKGLQAIQEGLEASESSLERYFQAELYRLKGELILKDEELGSNNQEAYQLAEECFQQAIAVAQLQHAKAWELRATISLSRLWAKLGRKHAAYTRLVEVYDWFSEGFETPDLEEARALLTILNDDENPALILSQGNRI